MRFTSSFPSGRESWSTTCILKKYCEFICSIDDHRRLVFADEKPMKEKDIFRLIRKNPMNGVTPNHRMKANSKNRYSILCAVTLKTGVNSVESVVLQECTDSCIFFEFVLLLLRKGTLIPGDIFIVDNCSVHMKGDNIGLQEALFKKHNVLMVTLPPYHPDFNPTELVLNIL